jgi:hypothetical protein
MALDRIASATSYSALDLVRAATENAPRLASPVAGPATSTAGSESVLRLIASPEGQAAAAEAFSALPPGLRGREDALGSLLDARA